MVVVQEAERVRARPFMQVSASVRVVAACNVGRDRFLRQVGVADQCVCVHKCSGAVLIGAEGVVCVFVQRASAVGVQRAV